MEAISGSETYPKEGEVPIMNRFSEATSMKESIVYYSSSITPKTIIELYQRLEFPLQGKIAAKIHSGERGNQNYIGPEYLFPIITELGATIVETNTAYPGARNTTKRHLELMKEHGWDGLPVEILDAHRPDLALPVRNPLRIPVNYVGKGIEAYDSMIVLSHFKGHPMGGFGGALKQLSIGCASSHGKANIHSAGASKSPIFCWTKKTPQDAFLESMVDAAGSVMDYFSKKKGIVYINIMKNMSVDCDCCAKAEDPCLKDIGILASCDPLALDAACLRLVEQSDDPGKQHFLERVNSRHGYHTIEMAEKQGLGSTSYILVNID